MKKRALIFLAFFLIPINLKIAADESEATYNGSLTFEIGETWGYKVEFEDGDCSYLFKYKDFLPVYLYNIEKRGFLGEKYIITLKDAITGVFTKLEVKKGDRIDLMCCTQDSIPFERYKEHYNPKGSIKDWLQDTYNWKCYVIVDFISETELGVDCYY